MPIFFASTKPVSSRNFAAIDFVLQIAAAEVLIVGLLEVHAVAGGSPNVRRDADVAARRESGGSRG